MAAHRDLIARQYANGFREVLGEGLPALREALEAGSPLETAIVATYLRLLACHPDSLIERKYGHGQRARSRARGRRDRGGLARARSGAAGMRRLSTSWLRQPANAL